MVMDFDRFSADEIRNNFILSKELLRCLAERSLDDFSFRRYVDAYLALCDSISAFDRVQSK